MATNEELKQRREAIEKHIFKTSIEFLLGAKDGAIIAERLGNLISQSELVRIIDLFSKMSAKKYDDIVIKIDTTKEFFEQHMMVDIYGKVSYSRSVQQFDGYPIQMPGAKFVSHSQENTFSVDKTAVIADSIKLLPFMSIVKVDGVITNELIFYIK